MIPIAFEIFIVVGVVFSFDEKATLMNVEEPTSIDTFCIRYTVGYGIVFTAFVLMVTILSCCTVKKRVELAQKLRLISLYTKFQTQQAAILIK